MSKSEKRTRKLAFGLGAAKHANGRIEPPSFAENPAYYFVFGGLVALAILFSIIQAMKH